MKILLVNTNDINGGAARAANRLHHALLSENIESKMLVINKQGDDYTIMPFSQNFGRLRNRLRNLQLRFFNTLNNYPNKSKTLFSSSFLEYSNIVDTINHINPDIVHLHWICNEMIKIEDLAKIKAPIVWSLHDMWAFTGGCHYDEECGRYVDHCGQCRVLNSSIKNDLSRKVFIRKQKTYSQITNMTIIGLSHWLSECAKQSTLFKDKHVVTLPNPIDTNIFKPFDNNIAREILSLPKDKQLILFGAMSATSDPRKGFSLLLDAINNLQLENVELVVFGSSKPECTPDFKFKVHYLGQLHDDTTLQILYSACDVMVASSLQENLSNTIMECLSCATPVVAFAVGGNADMIDHKKNGYLATPFDIYDLAQGIITILFSENYNALCIKARQKVLDTFDNQSVVNKYINLYSSILNKEI